MSHAIVEQGPLGGAFQAARTRTKSARPVWLSDLCEENNSLVRIGNKTYYRNADGLLMPMKKGQKPPDLRFFNQRRAGQDSLPPA